MRVYRLDLRRFRGFDEARVEPGDHVVLVGEPGGGRSDVIEGLGRVLSADSTRVRLPDDLDFFGRDTSKRSEVEVTLGDLGPDLEQLFFDHLEVWEREPRRIVDELADPQLLDRDNYDFVVRLCYRIAWVEAEDRADHWVDFPKTSDPDVELVDRVRRAQREAIPFAMVASEAIPSDSALARIFGDSSRRQREGISPPRSTSSRASSRRQPRTSGTRRRCVRHSRTSWNRSARSWAC